MAWETLKTDYVDAVFDGLRKYTQVSNSDGTYSFVDVTTYTVKEGSFFGASDVNAINTAINAIMAALENGTDLYEVFTEFFENQRTLFEETAQEYNVSFEEYLAALKETLEADCAQLQADYATEIEQFENTQETAFNTWFAIIKDQLSTDAAGNLQEEIDALTQETFERYYGLVATKTSFPSDGSIVITNSEATITVVKTENDDGTKVITETIVPTEGSYNYIKTTTITPATETTDKEIAEEYSSRYKL